MVNGPSFNNIFLTKENLAFALPLIFVCTSYAYFKYVPLPIALSIIAVLVLVNQIRSYFQGREAKKLTTLDDSMVRELAGDDADDEGEKSKAAEAQRKAKTKVEMRLAQEKKAQRKKQSQNNNKNKTDAEENMDEDDALLMFAKGSRDKKKTK